MSPATSLYNDDFYSWSQHQAALLRAGKVHELDLANVAEELESLGISQRHALENRLAVLVRHLLKWQYQPERRQRGRSWQITIVEQRSRIHRLLRDSPSLRRHVTRVLEEDYPTIRLRTQIETGLPPDALPAACPWTEGQILDECFWPEAMS